MPRRVATTDPASMTALVDHVRADLGLPTSTDPPRVDVALARLAVRHGCSAAVERTATTAGVDDDALQLLRNARRDRALRSISNRSLADTVLAELRGHGVEALVVKGIALAALTVRPASERPGNDLDLLVRAHDLLSAHDALVASGWAVDSAFPAPGEDSRTRYVVWNYNEVEMRRGGASIDLHWRLLPVRLPILDTDSAFAESIHLDIDGAMVPTISADRAAAHVVAHAAKDAWRSLSSVIDLHLLEVHAGVPTSAIVRHFPRRGALPVALAAVEFLRSGRPVTTAAEPPLDKWCRGVTAVHDDQLPMSPLESIAFRARWLALRPTPGNAAVAVCNLVLPPAALTWSRLSPRWWPFALPERLWRAVSRTRPDHRHRTPDPPAPTAH